MTHEEVARRTTMDNRDVVDLLATLLEDTEYSGVSAKEIGKLAVGSTWDGLTVKFVDGSEFEVRVVRTREPDRDPEVL